MRFGLLDFGGCFGFGSRYGFGQTVLETRLGCQSCGPFLST